MASKKMPVFIPTKKKDLLTLQLEWLDGGCDSDVEKPQTALDINEQIFGKQNPPLRRSTRLKKVSIKCSCCTQEILAKPQQIYIEDSIKDVNDLIKILSD